MVQEMSLVGTTSRVTASNQGAAVKKPPDKKALCYSASDADKHGLLNRQSDYSDLIYLIGSDHVKS